MIEWMGAGWEEPLQHSMRRGKNLPDKPLQAREQTQLPDFLRRERQYSMNR